MLEATLRLFKGVYVEGKFGSSTDAEKIMQIEKGFYLNDQIPYTSEVRDAIMKVVMTPEVNATFFKSWEYIRNTLQERLFFHQIFHYITTYGLGLDGYIPDSEVDNVDVKIPIIHIQALTLEDIIEGIKALGANVALSEQTLEDILTIIVYLKLEEPIKVSNRELTTRINDFYDIVPSAPVEFLRHWIYTLTGETVLIKSPELIEKLKNAENIDALIPLAPMDLASIFYRFKPLFLAMKQGSKNKRFFNQLRRKAVKLHKAMPEDLIATVMSKCLKDKLWQTEAFVKQLQYTSNFRKIRLLNAITFRLEARTNAIVYKIRNSKTWTTTTKVNIHRSLHELKLTLILSIINSLNIKGNTYYIPKFIEYACPTSEKDFMGNIPCGSCVSIKEDMIVGISWENVKGRQTDLDLSAVSLDGKVGWDTSHTSSSKSLVYSGDITNAPTPVNENFLISKDRKVSDLFTVNYYNHSSEHPVPAKIFVARHTGNEEEVLMSAPLDITGDYHLLGLHTPDGFYFQTGNFGNICSSRESEQTRLAREFFTESNRLKLTMRDLLQTAGAKVVSENEEGAIDLSPEYLKKDTLITILT